MWGELVSSASIIGVFSFVLGVLAKTLIDRGFGFYLSRHLEDFKSILRKGEDEFRRKLQQQDVQLQAIREAALRQFAERSAALDRRQLEAYDRLWMAVIGQNQFKLASRFAQTLNIDEILKEAMRLDSEGQKARNFGEQLWKMSGLDKLRQVDPPDKERPFISAIAWARFSAYRAALGVPVAQFAAVKSGADPKILADPKPLLDAVKSAFPKWATFLGDHGAAGLSFIVNDMEEEVLQTIVESINDPGIDKGHIQAASEIVNGVNKFVESERQASAPPAPKL